MVGTSREDNPGNNKTDRELIREIRDDTTIDHEEIDSWVKVAMIEPGDVEQAYRILVDASDVAGAFR